MRKLKGTIYHKCWLLMHVFPHLKTSDSSLPRFTLADFQTCDMSEDWIPFEFLLLVWRHMKLNLFEMPGKLPLSTEAFFSCHFQSSYFLLHWQCLFQFPGKCYKTLRKPFQNDVNVVMKVILQNCILMWDDNKHLESWILWWYAVTPETYPWNTSAESKIFGIQIRGFFSFIVSLLFVFCTGGC